MEITLRLLWKLINVKNNKQYTKSLHLPDILVGKSAPVKLIIYKS